MNTVDEKSEDMFNEHKDDWVADMQDDIVVLSLISIFLPLLPTPSVSLATSIILE